MNDPTIKKMREAVEEMANNSLYTVRLSRKELVIEMARRYLAMMEEGPVGVVDNSRTCLYIRRFGTVWLDKRFPEFAPHRLVYAHPKEEGK